MIPIIWEKDATGTPVVTERPEGREEGRYVSPVLAACMVSALTHEITAISAEFTGCGTVRYVPRVSISVLEKTFATFYGLYAADDNTAGSKYCIRHCAWDRGFRSIDLALNGLSSRTLFFDCNDLPAKMRELITRLDRLANDEYVIYSTPSASERFNKNKIEYSLQDAVKTIFGRYRGVDSTNPAIEKLFGQLERFYAGVCAMETISPREGSFKIDYGFQNITVAYDDGG